MMSEKTADKKVGVIGGIEQTEAMEKAIEEVVALLHEHMAGLNDNGERFDIGMRVACTIAANTLANGLRNHRHLIDPAIENIAEQVTEMTKITLECFDNGTFTAH